MASSGTIKSWVVPSGYYTNENNSYAGAHYSFEWTATQKSSGVTTVSWKLWGRGRYVSPTQLWHRIRCSVTYNGTTTSLYDHDYLDGCTAAQYSFNDNQKTTGSFDVTHDATSGAGSFTVDMNIAIYRYNEYHATSETATLDTNRSKVMITGNVNGGTAATISQIMDIDTSTALSLTTPTRSGYVFRYWNTKADGSGTSYVNGDALKLSDNLTLYAIWGNRYYVTYNGNNSTSGSVSKTTHYYGVSSNLATNSYQRVYTMTYNGNGGTPARSSDTVTYTANGWNKNSSGTGTSYANGAAVTNLSSTQNATVTLYAKWDSASTTLPTASYSGYRFLGWNTK
jgi:uncharacterized repeat protein (TIGR02543 family)